MFDFQPHLQGECVTMRPYCAQDWDALLAVASDPLIWDQHPIHGEWREEVFRIGEQNWRSRKALEKIGGVLLDRTQLIPFMGRELLHVCYAMTRQTFAHSAS
jgi:hypothetical protein